LLNELSLLRFPIKKNSGLVPGVTGETDTAVDRAVGDSGRVVSFPFSSVKTTNMAALSQRCQLDRYPPTIPQQNRIDFISFILLYIEFNPLKKENLSNIHS
jgi:hypothetical protein